MPVPDWILALSPHAKREAEVQTLFQLTYLQFLVRWAGADPPDTFDGKFTSPVTIISKLAVLFISLVIVDLPFHSRCGFEDAHTRSRALPPLPIRSRRGM